MFEISLGEVQTFFLICARIAGIVFTAPVFDSRNIPTSVKAGVTLALAVAMFPLIDFRFANPSLLKLFVSVLGEAAVGMVIGIGTRILFSAVELAGQLVGFQMGLGIVSVIDPLTQARLSVVAEFKYLIAMLLFFSLDIHHVFLRAIAGSYKMIPIAGMVISSTLVEYMMKITVEMFVLALKIGAPIIAVNLFVSVGLGIVARTVPQINVFIVGFPLKIGVGLITVGLSMPYWIMVLKSAFASIGSRIDILLRAM